MTEGTRLAPPRAEASATQFKRFGASFGPRFFVLVAIGLVWIAAAFVDVRFIGALIGWNVLVALAWLVDFRRLPPPDRLVVGRVWLGPPALSVPSTVRLTVGNDSTRTIRVSVVDEIPHQLRAEPPTVDVVVGARAAAAAEYVVLPQERGAAPVGDAFIRYQTPFRIAERWARARLAQTVVTYPNLEEARRESISLVRSRQIDRERRSRRIRGAGRSFESLREYREGDEVRDLCWTASARRGKLVTRLFEVEKSQTIWVLIDSGRLMRTKVENVTKLDHAVNAALSLAQVALASGDRVGLLAYGRRISHRLPASRGAKHLRRIVDRLAVVQADEWEADHLQAASRLLSDQKRRSLVVWITDIADTAMTPEIVQAAWQLMPRHLVLFVVIGQPDVNAVAAQKPQTAADMYQSAAAQEVTHRRDLLLARLRARGALALEATTRLSAALVNAYLEIKQRDRL